MSVGGLRYSQLDTGEEQLISSEKRHDLLLQQMGTSGREVVNV